MIFSAFLSNTPTYKSHIYHCLCFQLNYFCSLCWSSRIKFAVCVTWKTLFLFLHLLCFLPEQMVNEVLKNKRSIEGKHSHLCVCDSLSLAGKSHFDLCVFLCVSLAEFCLSCGKTSATFHPLFEGGLCPTCKVERQTHVT